MDGGREIGRASSDVGNRRSSFELRGHGKTEMSGAPDWIRTSICRFRRSVPFRSSHWSFGDLTELHPVELERRLRPHSPPMSGSRPRFRTQLRRLTAGRPHRDGSTGMNWWRTWGSHPPRPACKADLSPSSFPDGAWSLNRTNLFRSSDGRVDHDHYPGEIGAAGGKSNPSSPRWQRGALPLSYGRNLVGRDGLEPSQHMRDFYRVLGSPMPSLP